MPLLWWVYPDERAVEVVYRLGVLAATLREGDVLDGEDVLPGFTLPVSELFQSVPRHRAIHTRMEFVSEE